jgi:hypothetical protein
MESCGGLATRLERRLPTGAQLDKLPHKEHIPPVATYELPS